MGVYHVNHLNNTRVGVVTTKYANGMWCGKLHCIIDVPNEDLGFAGDFEYIDFVETDEQILLVAIEDYIDGRWHRTIRPSMIPW